MSLEAGEVQGDAPAQSRIMGIVNRGDFETLQAYNDDQRAPAARREAPFLIRG